MDPEQGDHRPPKPDQSMCSTLDTERSPVAWSCEKRRNSDDAGSGYSR